MPQVTGRERQARVRRIAIVKRNVRGRVSSSRHIDHPRSIRIEGKNTVNLDPYFADVSSRCAASKQPGKSGTTNKCSGCQQEVVRRLNFHSAGASRARRGRDQPVWGTGAKEEHTIGDSGAGQNCGSDRERSTKPSHRTSIKRQNRGVEVLPFTCLDTAGRVKEQI